jgi:hypothetical protein
MFAQETSVEIRFVEEQGTQKILGYAKSFMKHCGLIILENPEITTGRYVVKGFPSTGYIDIESDLTGCMVKDVAAIYNAVEYNKELNSHALYNGCRVVTVDKQIRARIYYTEGVSMN